mgnify:CR=1 FL=1
MNPYDYQFASSQHHRLLDAAASAREARLALGDAPTLKDHICLSLGGWLIAFGSRIRSASRLSHKASLNELSSEC